MEFFRIHKTIPFMRHALVLNIVSFVTFALAVFFLLHRGLHLSVEFTGGTVMEVAYTQSADVGKVREIVGTLGYTEVQVQSFGTVGADPPACEEGRNFRPAERRGDDRAEGGRADGGTAQQRIRRPAGRRRAHHQRPEGPGHGGRRHHDLPGVPLRMEVCAGYRAGQPARRGDHPGLLRLLPVGVLAGGAGGGAGGAGVFGERVGRDLRPDPRELPPLPQDDDHRDHRQRDHLDHQPDHHHPRLHPAGGAVDVLLRRPDPALLCAGADHRHLLRHLLVGLRGGGDRHVAGREARGPDQGDRPSATATPKTTRTPAPWSDGYFGVQQSAGGMLPPRSSRTSLFVR